MNWKRGLFKVWIIFSILWVGAITWVAYHDLVAPGQAAARGVPVGTVLMIYAGLAIGPVVGTLVLWIVGAWAAAGSGPKR